MGFLDLFSKQKALFFPECTTFYKNKEGFKAYQEIFKKLGINYFLLDEHLCSGIEILQAGYEQEARKQARKVFDLFQEKGVDAIITTDPKSYKVFTQDYKEFLPDWNIKVVNIWELILERLRKKHQLIKNRPVETITFHDSCHLGRYCKIYEEPRQILQAIGYQIEEMDNAKEDAFCSGGCGNLPFTNPPLANKIARERVLQAKRIGVKKMVVTSFDSYNLLRKNAKNTGVEIVELSYVLAHALDIPIGLEESVDEEENVLLEEKIKPILTQNEEEGNE